MSNYDDSITIRVSADDKKEFLAQCAETEVLPSGLLRRFIRDYTDGAFQYVNKLIPTTRK